MNILFLIFKVQHTFEILEGISLYFHWKKKWIEKSCMLRTVQFHLIMVFLKSKFYLHNIIYAFQPVSINIMYLLQWYILYHSTFNIITFNLASRISISLHIFILHWSSSFSFKYLTIYTSTWLRKLTIFNSTH